MHLKRTSKLNIFIPDNRQNRNTLQYAELNTEQEIQILLLLRHAFQSLSYEEEGEPSSFQHVYQKGITPPLCTYWSLLKACGKSKALAHAKHLSFCLLQHPLQPIIHTHLGQYVVVTLVKCGSLEDALEIFNILPSRSVFAFTAVISGYTACGRSLDALNMYYRMRDEAVEPNGHTFVSLLIACGNKGLLEEGIHLHVKAHICNFHADLFVHVALMDMYAKCGSITHVEKVFDGLPEYNAVAWTTMLFAYVENGEPKKVLQLYKQMQEQGVISDDRTIVSALQACGMAAESERCAAMDGHSIESSTLETGKAIHVEAEVKSFHAQLYVGNSLMIMYGKCGSIAEAENVFAELSQRSVVSWTTMLAIYAENKEGEKGLRLLRQMQIEGVSANAHTLVVVLQACCVLAEKERHVQGDSILQIGMGLHANARKLGHISNVFVSNTIINMYGRAGSLSSAVNVFLQLRECSQASWNSMLAAFLEQGEAGKALQLYAHMQNYVMTVDHRTFVVVLQACGILADSENASNEEGYLIKMNALQIGCALHDDARKEGFDIDHFVCNKLISMYGKCGSFSKARAVFDSLSEPNIVSWHAILSAYVDSGRLTEAEHTFIHLPQLNVVSWNIMLLAYGEGGEADLALETYRQNCFKSFIPTCATFMAALQACCAAARDEQPTLGRKKTQKVNALKAGQLIHFEADIMGLDLDVRIGSSLVSMYSSCGQGKEAETMFLMLPRHEVLSNAMLSAYAELGEGDKVLQLHREMKEESAKFYDATLTSVLHVCVKEAGFVELCRDIHFTAVSGGHVLPVDILVHAYGSCAAVVDALAIFETLPDPHGASRKALIAVLSHHSDVSACLKLFEEMKLANMRLDGVCLLSVLFACAHSGLVEYVLNYFAGMIRDYCIVPEIQHYGLIVHSLGRVGDFKRVESLIVKMPLEPDLNMWTCLLTACYQHSHLELAETVFNCAIHLGPIEGAVCVLISNVFAIAKPLHSPSKQDMQS